MKRNSLGISAALAVAACVAGCSGSRSFEDDQTGYVTRGLAKPRDQRSVDPGDLSRPVVAVDGITLSAATAWPTIAEAAGPGAAEEIVLSYLIDREAAAQGIAVTEAEIEAERRLVTASMAGVGGMGAEAERTLERIRRERGLGPDRWRALLRRNALLRAMVRDEVVVTEEAVERAYLLRYGPAWRARVIVTPTQQAAAAAVQRVRGGEEFGVVAAEVSTDASAGRGGVIDPINPADTTWPLAVRQAVQRMEVGAVSEPIVVDGGFVVVRVEGVDGIAGSQPSMEAVRAEMEGAARIEAERLAMQTLAAQIRSAARVEILDPSLGWGR